MKNKISAEISRFVSAFSEMHDRKQFIFIKPFSVKIKDQITTIHMNMFRGKQQKEMSPMHLFTCTVKL